MELTLTADWTIALDSASQPARLAAEELRAHLGLLGAPDLPVRSAAPGPRIALRHGPTGDGFMRAPDEHGLVVRGAGPRGLLYAVYDLLEALGCRWVAPGVAGTHYARHATVTLPNVAIADRPALAVRGLIIGHDHFLDEAEGWIIWAARNRLNTLFVHTTIHEPALGACRLALWRARRRTLLPLLRERGLRVELGGHHLRDLLPRRLFRDEPTLFRHDGTRRTPDHNLCVSNPRALARLCETGAAFFRAYPEAEVYHLWPDDLRAGGWCHCPTCAALSPADQALTAANALAATLAGVRPDARVAYLAYHDTEGAAARVVPHPNLSLLFAPRTRSYAVGIAAPANATVAARLDAGAAAFGATDNQPRAQRPNVAVFEYYLDGILFKSSPPPLASVIAADMAHYRAAGVGAVHVLLTGDRPFAWAPVNAYLFARLAWTPGSSPTALIADYAAARAPACADLLTQAYGALEAAWQPALARDPALEPPARPTRARDPVAAPPADILDTIGEPRLTLERRLEAMRVAADHLTHGRAVWAEIFAAGAAAHLADERAEWELGALLLEFLRLRQQLYVLAARNASQHAITDALAEAQGALDALLTWATRHVPPNARAGHRLLRAAFQLQLDHIADRRLLAPWARLGLRARRAADLAKLLPWLIR